MVESKGMWELFPEIWNTQAKYMAWVRGGIRKGLWNRHPIKLNYLKSKGVMKENTNPRSMKRFPKVKKFECEECKRFFSTQEVEVDHKEGNKSLKSMDDLRSFIESMIEVRQEDLQILCKTCHKVKSFSERNGISFEEAEAEKAAISVLKDKKDKAWLIERGITPESNQKKRRQQIVEEILNGKK